MNTPDPDQVKFRNGEHVVTLYVEIVYDDGWVYGYCPELKNSISVHPSNLVEPGPLVRAQDA